MKPFFFHEIKIPRNYGYEISKFILKHIDSNPEIFISSALPCDKTFYTIMIKVKPSIYIQHDDCYGLNTARFGL